VRLGELYDRLTAIRRRVFEIEAHLSAAAPFATSRVTLGNFSKHLMKERAALMQPRARGD
jgi:hypothetical protein